MRNPSGQTLSIWTDTVPRFSASHVGDPRKCDVCVIGGGIAGLTTAYLLQTSGRNVTLIERNEIATGESGRTTAHFASSLDDRYFHLEDLHGEKNSKLLAESQVEAIKLACSIIEKEKISCDVSQVPGYLFCGPEHDESYLEKEYVAALRAGLDVELVDSAVPSLSPGRWLLFRRQMQLHPAKYLQGLARAFVARGGELRQGVAVDSVKWARFDCAEIRLANGTEFDASYVVTATNTPFIDKFAMHTKQAAYRTYVIAAEVPRDSMRKALYWDTSDPYHYVRLENNDEQEFERIIIGGEDHKTGQDDSPEIRWSRLEAWARTHIPMLGKITHRWSGQVMEPVDGVAYAGMNPVDSPHSFIITGDSGNGMTNGTIGARIVADRILGIENRFAELYSPYRKNLMSSGEYLKENMNVAAQYADYFRGPESPSFADLARGEGAVMKIDGEKVAAYRDPAGRLKLCSAICPHLGAVVHWNAAERSWDCPAHGSRFDCEGHVLNGPANKPLEYKDTGVVGGLKRVKQPKVADDGKTSVPLG